MLNFNQHIWARPNVCYPMYTVWFFVELVIEKLQGLSFGDFGHAPFGPLCVYQTEGM